MAQVREKSPTSPIKGPYITAKETYSRVCCAQGRMTGWGPRAATAPRHLTSQRARLARTDRVSYITHNRAVCRPKKRFKAPIKGP